MGSLCWTQWMSPSSLGRKCFCNGVWKRERKESSVSIWDLVKEGYQASFAVVLPLCPPPGEARSDPFTCALTPSPMLTTSPPPPPPPPDVRTQLLLLQLFQAWIWYLLVFGSWHEVCHQVSTEPGDSEASPGVHHIHQSPSPTAWRHCETRFHHWAGNWG